MIAKILKEEKNIIIYFANSKYLFKMMDNKFKHK